MSEGTEVLREPLLPGLPSSRRPPEGAHRVSLEGLDGPVLAQLAHVDAHVRAAGRKRVVTLPVHVQGRR